MSFKLDKKQQIAEILKCGKDPSYFLKNYARISHPMHSGDKLPCGLSLLGAIRTSTHRRHRSKCHSNPPFHRQSCRRQSRIPIHHRARRTVAASFSSLEADQRWLACAGQSRNLDHMRANPDVHSWRKAMPQRRNPRKLNKLQLKIIFPLYT